MLLNCFLTKFRRKFVISATQLRASDSKEGLCHLFAALTEGLTEGIIHHVSTTIMQSRSKFGCLASLIYNLKDITLRSLWVCRGFKDSKSFTHVYMRWNEITCTQSQKSRKTVFLFSLMKMLVKYQLCPSNLLKSQIHHAHFVTTTASYYPKDLQPLIWKRKEVFIP